MTDDLNKLRSEFHTRVLDARAMDRILRSREFQEAYDRAIDSEIKELQFIIEDISPERLRSWMFDILYGSLECLSHRRLREMAKRLNIFRWSRLSKPELIEEIEECKRRTKTSRVYSTN